MPDLDARLLNRPNSSTTFGVDGRTLTMWREERQATEFVPPPGELRGFSVCLQLQGDGELGIDRYQVTISKGEILILHPHRDFCWRPLNNDSSCVVVAGSGRNVLQASALHRLTTTLKEADPTAPFLREYMLRLEEILSNASRSTSRKLIDTFAELVLAGVRPDATDESGDFDLELKFTAALHHIDNIAFDSSALAQLVEIPLRSLQKRLSGLQTTPSEWIWRSRLERARKRLDDPVLRHLSIRQIALSSGFRDLAHFSRRFKSHFGLTPRAYRLK
jgi:AraC-like DNA-binding protein